MKKTIQTLLIIFSSLVIILGIIYWAIFIFSASPSEVVKVEKPCTQHTRYMLDVPWGEDSPLGDNLEEAERMAKGRAIYKYTWCN